MPCYHPITAVQPTTGGQLSFPKEEHLYLYNDYKTLQIPCGQCRGCRLKKSREWAMRCLHEKQMHKHNSYITLTYDAQHLPANLSLQHADFQKFLKRLRKALSKGVNAPTALLTTYIAQQGRYLPTADVKYYMCGEYGELHGRPHYHALLFGVDFADRIIHKITNANQTIYKSQTLANIWKKGYTSIGDITFESAAYIARYVMKKQTGDGNLKEYKIIDPETGEIHTKTKEYNQMSRRPGIGASWIEKYRTDVYTTGKVIIRGHKNNPPRYYDKNEKKFDAAITEHFQYTKYLEQLAQAQHQTPERLAVQEQVAEAKIKSLRRKQPWETS